MLLKRRRALAARGARALVGCRFRARCSMAGPMLASGLRGVDVREHVGLTSPIGPDAEALGVVGRVVERDVEVLASRLPIEASEALRAVDPEVEKTADRTVQGKGVPSRKHIVHAALREVNDPRSVMCELHVVFDLDAVSTKAEGLRVFFGGRICLAQDPALGLKVGKGHVDAAVRTEHDLEELERPERTGHDHRGGRRGPKAEASLRDQPGALGLWSCRTAYQLNSPPIARSRSLRAS